MRKNILIGVGVFVLFVVGGAYFLAQRILASDSVRTAIATQVSKAIGQKVTIGSIGASIFPRVSVNLGEVAIGEPAKIQVETLSVGTAFGALLSRRIEHASLRLAGARIELPLPPLGAPFETATPVAAAESSAPPVELVSIDEIVLSDVEIVSGGRTLRGEIEAVMEGQGLALRNITLEAEGTTIKATGKITDLTAPAGELSIKAGQLNVDQLLAFASDFSGGAGVSAAGGPRGTPAPQAARASASPAASALNMTVSVEAERATMGALAIEKLSGRAHVTSDAIAVEPIGFGLFGGRYEGALALMLSGAAPAFRWNATLSGIDVAAATAFAGSPDTVTGRLSGKMDLTGTGADAGTAIKTARGTVRIDVTDGVVKNLGLVRTIVTATSLRSAAKEAAGGSNDEPFSRLGATLVVANGSATTNDLLFESKNLGLNAAGTAKLDGSAVNLAGKVQLSEALTKQAGSDLARYAQEGGRVTLPVTVSGPAESPSVRIDVGDLAKRAITNRAKEEAQKQLKGGLGGLFRK